jgi:hypothetical protein
MNKRVVFSVVAGVVVYVTLSHLMGGPPHCVDGSLSGSIGRRGACSHHGGVADPSFIPLLAAIAVGFLAHHYTGALTAVRARRAAKTPPLAVAGRRKSIAEPLTWMPKKIERPTRKVDIGAVIATSTLIVFALVAVLAAIAEMNDETLTTAMSAAPRAKQTGGLTEKGLY